MEKMLITSIFSFSQNGFYPKKKQKKVPYGPGHIGTVVGLCCHFEQGKVFAI